MYALYEEVKWHFIIAVANQNSTPQPLVNAAKALVNKKNGGKHNETINSPNTGYNK